MQRLSLLVLLLTTCAFADDLPKVLDDRLKLELIAEAPVVRTPTGIAIDDKGRVYVIESHTHFPPPNYDGPKADRILRFEKKGEKWEPTVFFEGSKHTMGCGFHPDGSLWVATRMEVFKLRDKDDDGKISDGERTDLIKHETKGDYPHNGLSGFAFDFAGNAYFGQGENLGVDYKVIGSDGTTLTGGGEGGNIYCCDAEGKKLRRVATGFWNPFHLYIDPFGRLFAVDNDPDSRPPCRLLHVVEGGDYGYRFRNGRKGTHPFTAWSGELPGTLPMVSGTGEAPSGIIGAMEADLPRDYNNALFVTSWGDHRIEAYPLSARGASFGATIKPVVVGGENFRPVGIAADKDGDLWFSDWVDKSYQLHGKGALWRLSWKGREVSEPTEATFGGAAPAADSTPDDPIGASARAKIIQDPDRASRHAFALGGSLGSPPKLPAEINVAKLASDKNPPEVRYAAIRRLDPKKHLTVLRIHLADPDPFIQQAARWALRTVANDIALLSFEQERRPAVRLGLALVFAEANTPTCQKQIPKLLADSDPLVRFVAIKWIGEQRLKDVWNNVKDDVEKRLATRQELEAFLATSAFLSDEKYDPGKEARGEEFVVKILLDKNTSAERQAFLLRMLRADHPALSDDLLKKYIEGDNAALRLAALQVISQRGSAPKFLDANQMAQENKREKAERLEAISLLSPSNPKDLPTLLKLSKAEVPLIAEQAARTIRTDEAAAASNALAISRAGRASAEDLPLWQKTLDSTPGDAKSGSLVFHHAVAQCSRCHEAEGRGASIGPNLTGIGKTMTRERLIQSILQPSKEIAPQFAQWEIVTHDGKIHKGMYFGEEVDGTVIYADEKGQKLKIHPRDVESRTQQKTSIMPDGLVYRLTDQELRDLLAYLGSK
jgi:putative membrane-bound dehydrogenase-like protein